MSPASEVLRDWCMERGLSVDHSARDLAVWVSALPERQAAELGSLALIDLPPTTPLLPGWRVEESRSRSLSLSLSRSLSRSRSRSRSLSRSLSLSLSLSLSRSRGGGR